MRPSAPGFLNSTPLASKRPTFAEVHQAYASYVRELLRQRVPLRDAEDLEQQCLLAIHRGLPSYDPTRPLKPWLKTIVIRAIRDYRERSSTKCELLFHKTAEDSRSNSEEKLGTLELVRSVLSPLNPRQQQIVVRHLRDEESIEEIAHDLKISERGGHKLLQAARAKIADAVRRHRAQERRVLGGRGAFLFPFGLALCKEAWIARARSALGRAFAAVKALSATVGAAAGMVLSLGAVEPQARPSAPATASPVAVYVAAAPAPPAKGAAAAPPPAASMKSAVGPSSGAPLYRNDAAERSSLERIKVTLETDPAAALAALKLHKGTFLREQFRTDRESIESLARVLAQQQQGIEQESRGFPSHPR